MTAAELTAARLKGPKEEGRRPRAYNDATGKTVTCQPHGNLSIGYGINLENGLDEAEMMFLLTHRISLVENALAVYWWFKDLDPVRRSVVMDVGYNTGLHSLLHFPKMIAALGVKDWQAAHDELLDSDAARALPARYKPLAEILKTGVA